jgi:hypothetical protein
LNQGFVNFVKKTGSMQVASFTGFIKMLFYILAFYYVLKFLGKLFLPIILKKVVEKAGDKFQQQQRAQGNTWGNTQPKEEIIFSSDTSKNPRETKKVGDYVDYEEID